MQREPTADARDLVDELFPHARWALLTGSVLTARRTAGSDLDIVVVLPDPDPAAPHRQSRRFRGWPVELFVHDASTLAHYLAKDLPVRRPVMHRMVATGTLVIGRQDPHAASIRAECARVLLDGPPALTRTEHEWARYTLTDLLDELTHAIDPGERTVIATTGWVGIANAALALGRHWTGTGKWLLRELRDMDPELADRWVAAEADPEAVAALARQVLDGVGGPLFAGHRADGDRPS